MGKRCVLLFCIMNYFLNNQIFYDIIVMDELYSNMYRQIMLVNSVSIYLRAWQLLSMISAADTAKVSQIQSLPSVNSKYGEKHGKRRGMSIPASIDAQERGAWDREWWELNAIELLGEEMSVGLKDKIIAF